MKINKLNYILINLILKIFRIFPVRRNFIFFMGVSYNEFEGNCKSIYEGIKNKSNYNFIILNNKKFLQEKNIKFIGYKNFLLFYYITISKYCFFTSNAYKFFRKRENQIFVNLWHGAGAFKKFGRDENKNSSYLNKLKGDNLDLLIISTNKVQDIYSKALDEKKEKVKNLGLPRADIFFKEKEKQRVRKEFYKNYPELKNKKIILYAPTFRDNEKNKFNLKLDIKLMKENLEGLNYILLLKLHPGIKSKDIQVDNKFSYNFSNYPNTADLLVISDILISDYSSIIFEFSIMKKPILFYAYDVEEYIKDRGFYYNYYDFIPNKISYTTEEIIKAIINQEWDLERIEKFARYFFNPFDGNSTERVLKEVGLWEEDK